MPATRLLCLTNAPHAPMAMPAPSVGPGQKAKTGNPAPHVRRASPARPASRVSPEHHAPKANHAHPVNPVPRVKPANRVPKANAAATVAAAIAVVAAPDPKVMLLRQQAKPRQLLLPMNRL